MFFSAKKIVYLSLYEKGEKIRSAGFAGIYREKQEIRLTVQIKNAGPESDGDAQIFLVTGQGEVCTGRIELREGCGSYERRFALVNEKMRAGTYLIGAEEISEIRVAVGGERTIEGKPGNPEADRVKEVFREKAAGEDKKEERKEIRKEGKKEESQREERKEEGGRKDKKKEVQITHELEALQKKEENMVLQCQESYPGDKWEQLKRQYRKVHPFGDEREFIAVELKDFVVLGERYQKLINNSFLLHGFYNYRHLILGKDRRIGADTGTCFYLGVPGVFFEREKMVAIMFGFEGFECAGPVEIGKFGYYLRSVEI